MKLIPFLCVAALSFCNTISAIAQDSQKLSGTVLSTDFHEGKNPEYLFDGDLTTCFNGKKEGSYARPWAGLDLGTAHVITKIGFAPSSESISCSRLAIFEGANSADFIDAMPIAMIPTSGITPGKLSYIPVNVSRGFRYVRMVGAGGAQMHVAELEFYGIPGEGDDSQFFQISNIPTIAFNTPGMKEIVSKDDKHSGSTVYVISDNGKTLLSDSEAQMKGRGNASWSFEKKPFQIKFNKKQRILADAPAKAKKWTLINNYGDKTLMRNKIAFDMSKEAGMAYTPYCTFVDVIYNGEYQGCYQLCDQIEINENRVNITEMAPEDIAEPEISGGYFIEIDGYAESEKSWFRSHYNIPVTIKSPDEDEIVAAQSKYIEEHFNKMVDAVYSSKLSDPETGYRKYLDLDSFLRYFIIEELSGNTDAFWSTYMTKDRNSDKLVTGPVWDFDIAFNNDNRTFDINSKNDFVYRSGGSSAGDMNMLVSRIINLDSDARKQLSIIWSTLRKNGNYNAEYFNNLADKYAEEIAVSQKLNFTRWPILNTPVHQNPQALGSFEAELNAVKKYITRRFDQLDKLIGLTDVPSNSDIDTIVDESNTPVEYFTLQGLRVENPQHGIFIRRQGSSSTKVIL